MPEDSPAAQPSPTPAWKPSTVAVTAGRPPHEPDQPLNVPVTMASTYVAGGDLEYGRYGNPTWTAFEDALGALEGGRALSFSSGLAAVATVLDLVGQGAKVVAPRHSYNGTVLQLADLEARGRLRTELVDVTDTEAMVAACADAALVWLESPTNPALEIADIETITAAAHEAGAYVVVDNTFATPLLQKPLELDADVVVHSATKYLAGHSDVLMGA
ncbi:MAG: aminotransferase class I/II-fold pyridoxal phosphate-dependent enzyme, partial [Nocardioides sp.]